MSLGLSLLTSIIEGNNRSVVRNLNPDLFVQDERPAFDFFTLFYRQHGEIPSLQVMRENGFVLPPAPGPVNYMIERAVNRAIFNATNANLGDFQQALARQNGQALRDLIGQMQRGVSRFQNVNDVYSLADAAEIAMNEYARVRDLGGELPGITMGWAGLDALTGGAQPGEVVTWVARPNVGKSYTMSKVALEAHNQGRKVVLVSMEMDAIAMARRLIGVHARVNPDFIKRGTLSMWGEEVIFETIQAVRNGPEFILVSGNLTKTVPVVDALLQEHQPDVALIDAQYLMKPAKMRGNMKKHELLEEVGVEVQQMALARRIPVHQSVQYNRQQGATDAGDLKNIGGTDVVGQISSMVVGIKEGPAGREKTMREYELIKNREGRLGVIRTNFLFEPINFDEVPIEDGEDQAEAVNVDWMN